MLAVEWALVILLPTVVFGALISALRWARWTSERSRSRRAEAEPQVEPIERIEARLRRLRVELDATETRAGTVGKNARVTALRGAYVDVLSDACARLDVPPPGGDRAPLTEIYRVEAALRRRGLDVRQPAVH